jgi:ubiquitin-conjugating enzyme E2 T
MTVPGRAARLKREIDMLMKDPPEGVIVCQNENDADCFEARIRGPEESPFANGLFLVEMKAGPRYPFEPPSIRFLTQVYHPNIDETGRICLDSLKMPPAGNWRPSLNLSQILAQLRILLVEPGLGDPLMKDIADLYKNDHERYVELAKEWTEMYATEEKAIQASTTRKKKARLGGEEEGQ